MPAPNRDHDRIRIALEWLVVHHREQPTLEDLAAVVGLSPWHLQRLFTGWAGISPKRFVQTVTVAHARALLRDSQPVLDASFATGLSGPGRLHDLFVHVEAMTPGEYKAMGRGLRIRHGVAPSPFGPVLIAMTERGVCALDFVDDGGPAAAPALDWTRDEALRALRSHWPWAEFEEDDAAATEVARKIFERPAGRSGSDELTLHLKGTNFQVQVWRALLRIPEGAIVDYGGLAERLGRPDSARAVASAIGRNPVAVVIPCHRVLRRHGELGGYRWGLERKLALLGTELAPADQLDMEASSASASSATSLSG